ncbi:MAG: hypothetical protein M1828_003085 [Chrysothrix sp. TS-e1954]|nr:MAG: hypothetical protein M1828_003085 [Chrysothrix sp. TS-e1954]
MAGISAPSATETHVQNHITHLLTASPVYSHLFSGLKLHSVSTGTVKARLSLEPHLLNSKDSLHGSVSCALIDMMGGVAVASYDRRDDTGVSTDMHVMFISGAKKGDLIEVEGRVVRCGGTLAFTEVEVRKVGIGEWRQDVIAKGTHTKFVRPQR